MQTVASKTCPRCKQAKPADAFHKSKKSPDGLQCWCKECTAANQKEWLAKNPERLVAFRRSAKERGKRRYAEDAEFRDWLRRKSKEWRKRNPEKTSKTQRNGRLKRDYGIDQAEYDRRYAEQGGCCKLCGQHRKKLDVDHDHVTMAVRGLLCRPCNVGLGLLGDDEASLWRAMHYLKGEPAFQPLPFVA